MKPSQSTIVQAGDVIGWSSNSSAGDLGFENSAGPEYFYPSSSYSISVNSTLVKSGGASRYDISHVIKAHTSMESYASAGFKFANAGQHSVSFVVKNVPPSKYANDIGVCEVSVQVNYTVVH